VKEIEITCTWRSTHLITVPDDFEVPSTLEGFTPQMLDEMNSHTAELVDWE
jgi:hypothetical protein